MRATGYPIGAILKWTTGLFGCSDSPDDSSSSSGDSFKNQKPREDTNDQFKASTKTTGQKRSASSMEWESKKGKLEIFDTSEGPKVLSSDGRTVKKPKIEEAPLSTITDQNRPYLDVRVRAIDSDFLQISSNLVHSICKENRNVRLDIGQQQPEIIDLSTILKRASI